MDGVEAEGLGMVREVSGVAACGNSEPTDESWTVFGETICDGMASREAE